MKAISIPPPLALLLLLALLCGTLSPALSAPPEPAKAQTDRETLTRLISTLEDTRQRDSLVADLKALLAATDASATRPKPESLKGQSLSETLGGLRQGLMERLQAAVDSLGTAPLAWTWMGQWFQPGTWSWSSSNLPWLAVVLTLAALVESLTGLALRPARRWLGRSHGLATALLLLACRASAPVMFAFTVYALAPRLLTPVPEAATGTGMGIGIGLTLIDPTLLFALEVALTRLIAKFLVILLRFLLRIAREDHDLRTLRETATRVIQIGLYGHLGLTGLTLAGLPDAVEPLLREIVNVTLVIASIRLLVRHAGELNLLLAGRETSADTPAPEWNHGLILGVVGLYAIWLLIPGMEPARYVSAMVVTMATLLTMTVGWSWSRSTLRRLLVASDSTVAKARQGLFRIVHFGIGTVSVAAGSVVILEAWGLPAVTWLASPRGGRLLGDLIVLLLTLFVVVLLWQLLNIASARILAPQLAGQSPGASRARTLVPMVRTVARGVLLGAALLTVLGELGIDVTSLLAGAGVLGLVAGWGSQALVKDLLGGVSLLYEDTLRVGDEVELGGRSGTVESLSLRTVRLRDSSGNVLTIPFSSITTVANMNRGPTTIVIDLRVSISEDLSRFVSVIQKVGSWLAETPEYRELLTAPVQVMGVEGFDNGVCVVRVQIQTPGRERFRVRRVFNQRLKEACEADGITGLFPVTPPFPGSYSPNTTLAMASK
ncbi:MAG: mechanosensitive ion channel family protein [Alphaproteobacteria bacterium]